MFLKRIEMQGFKSFADKIVINFEDGVTGVVGPNGCGKSNISDAIRWVLGEQSVKSLRGEKMSDVIFSGSSKRKAVGMAEVTLVFDNHNRNFNIDVDEVEITRRIYHESQGGEYLINRRFVRLKDIQELILDSGLGKDTLSMISQGNITSFAEARPIDRRSLFEDAAGVGKYKKKKMESISKLEKTSENLERAFDILNELEKQVNPLKKQAEKALLFRDKKERLSQIEVHYLVHEIDTLHQQSNEVEKQLFELETNNNIHLTTIQLHENEISLMKEQLKIKQHDINNQQDELLVTIHNIQKLEARKIELDQKRKYEFEKASQLEKTKHLREMLVEAKYDYEQREIEIQNNQSSLQNFSDELDKLAYQATDLSMKKEELFNHVRRLENRKDLLNNLLKDPFSSAGQSGVKSIMDNKQSLYGILGVVGQVFQSEEGYQEALKAAIAGSTFHIITKDQESARHAIEFLKRNRSGRATFIPMDVLKPHFLNEQQLIICENSEGFLGTMDEFVDTDSQFDLVKDSMFANTIVCDNLYHANHLSNLLNKQVRIVTLEGDIVNKGGTMSGGKVKNESSLITAHSELKEIETKLKTIKTDLSLVLDLIQTNMQKRNDIQVKTTDLRIALANKETHFEIKKEKYEKLRSELELLSPDENFDYQEFQDEMILSLNKEYSRKDELTVSIKSLRASIQQSNSELDRKESQLKQVRKLIDASKQDERSLLTTKAQVDVKLEACLNRLACEYQLTYEYAKSTISDEDVVFTSDEINQLRSEIESLGNVNMEAPEEYQKLSERYEFVKNNYQDLKHSRDQILAIIEDMDELMKKQFKEMFDRINHELNDTFQRLFNGGRAKLVLEDPNDLLNSGIDIDVQPPGKAVKSIRLFSGGEKTLIAICVLFTILKVRPVPLVIFDEVEAALDQMNVERFAKYIQSVSDQTQFIVITHRPGTMAQCDSLYGVTMQQQGVSQLLKVKLVDAIEMSESKELS